MTGAINVNGRVSAPDEAVVSPLDHGFLYGEGVYEVCRTYHGRPFLFDRHMRRLRESASRLVLPVPWSDDTLAGEIARTLEAAGLRGAEAPSGYVRLLVTRGVGELNYDPASCDAPSLVIIVKRHVPPPAEVYDTGVAVALVSTVRNHPAALNPLIKSNNLLNNALAMQEALRMKGFEAVMRNQRGEIAECSQSNLFVVKGGEALTPPIEAGLLSGITRAFVLELARTLRVPAREAVLHDDDLFGADEAFLTSTTREIVPIVRVNERAIGAGRPGQVTRALLDAYRRAADDVTRGGRDAQTPAFSA
jgi:branched-chain amino acid aminotransferase